MNISKWENLCEKVGSGMILNPELVKRKKNKQRDQTWRNDKK